MSSSTFTAGNETPGFYQKAGLYDPPRAGQLVCHRAQPHGSQ